MIRACRYCASPKIANNLGQPAQIAAIQAAQGQGQPGSLQRFQTEARAGALSTELEKQNWGRQDVTGGADSARDIVAPTVADDVAKGYTGGAGKNSDLDNTLALSTRFVNRMDPMWKNSEKIKPISGYQDIVCHGDKTGFSYLDLDGNEINMTPRQFVEILKNSPVYEGRPIRLISCEAGADGAITAQYMASQLGVPVLAPTDIVYVYPDGAMKVGKYNTGK